MVGITIPIEIIELFHQLSLVKMGFSLVNIAYLGIYYLPSPKIIKIKNYHNLRTKFSLLVQYKGDNPILNRTIWSSTCLN